MLRSRPGLLGALIVAALVLLAAGGLFAIQYGEALADCTALPRPDTCAVAWPPQAAFNALFASTAGLLMAIVMAITVGINLRRDPPPSSALVLQLDEEDRYAEENQRRRAQFEEWTAMAQTRAEEKQAQSMAAQQAAIEAEAEVDVATALTSGASSWEEEPTPEETAEQKRRQRMAERLQLLARTKPEAVAEVLKGWINQPVR